MNKFLLVLAAIMMWPALPMLAIFALLSFRYRYQDTRCDIRVTILE